MAVIGVPLGICGYIVARWQEEAAYDARQLAIADDEGMAERFIPLRGISERRGLSWSEQRALLEDLRRSIVPHPIGRILARYSCDWGWDFQAFYGTSGP